MIESRKYLTLFSTILFKIKYSQFKSLKSVKNKDLYDVDRPNV